MNDTAKERWRRLEADYEAVAPLPVIGIIGLATDRVGIPDFEDFLAAASGRIAVFSTRIAMSPVATPATLAAMGAHLEAAAGLIVPHGRLDVVGFSCTSGTVAIGPDRVGAAITAARPGVAVSTPMQAGAKALQRLGARRIALLTPYLVPTAELVAGFFEAEGFSLAACATFELGGDPEMNRVTADCLIGAASDLAGRAGASDAVFISCTGLRTFPVVARLEARLGRPVVTSNQALAWDCLRLAGVHDRLPGRGRLFAEA